MVCWRLWMSDGVHGQSSGSCGRLWELPLTQASYAGYFDGNVYSTGSYQSSDKILKQNIRDFTSAMGIINKLHPTQYEFRQDGNYKLMMLPAGSHYGLIAQDVEKVLPNLIKETEFDPAMAKPHKPGEKNITKDSAKSDVINFKALNYTELIPIMIKGMQELSSQNDSLKDKSTVQEKINADLQNQINELKAMIVSDKSTPVPLNAGVNGQPSTVFLLHPFNKTYPIHSHIQQPLAILYH